MSHPNAIATTGGGFTGNTGAPTTQVVVLQAVVDQLVATIPQFGGRNTVFLAIDGADDSDRQNAYATVKPIGGTFDKEHWIGTGEPLEEAGVEVVIHSQMRLDRKDTDTKMLTDESRGLLVLKLLVLKALNAFMPINSDGNGILTAPMRPMASGDPLRSTAKNADEYHGENSLHFTTDFVWDLNAV